MGGSCYHRHPTTISSIQAKVQSKSMPVVTKVIFPERISLGGLYLADVAFPHQRKWIGEALGEFSTPVPDNKVLGLQVSGHASDTVFESAAESLRIMRSFDLSTSKFSDSLLKAIVQLEQTTELRLDFVPFEDNHVAKLAPMKNLTTLWLLHTAITNKSIRQLAVLPNLHHLVLKNTEITDGGLVHFKELPALTSLLLPSGITDNGLEELSNHKTLLHLDLSNSKVTNEGLKYLGTLANLQTLCLNDTVIGDIGVEHLKSLTNLKTLYISGTTLSDKGLGALEKIGLEYLEIRDTRVTEIGIARFHASLPECIVAGP